MKVKEINDENATTTTTFVKIAMERWSNRGAIVTGAGSGIGAATAKFLAENGMRVAAIDIDLSRVEATAKQSKGEIHPIQCDVSKEEDVVRVVKWTREYFGGADVLVNSAGIAPLCSLIDVDVEKIRKIMDVNVVGTCLFNREVLKDMRDRNVNDGHLFNLCSITGQTIIDHPNVAIYAGSKHTIRVMSEYLRRELRDLGTKIRITNISPGTVDTNISGLTAEEMETLKKEVPMLNPEDIAQAMLYALGTPPHVQVHEISIRPMGEKY